jgi:tripartite ATP-independent transporter DctP family solute receptor
MAAQRRIAPSARPAPKRRTAAPVHGPALNRRTVLAGAAAMLAGCGDRDGRAFITADTHPLEYPTVQAVLEMGRLMATRSEGRLSLRIYAGGQLGAERDTLEITTYGGIDLNRVNLAPLNSIEPLTAIPSLPFLFRSIDHMRRAMDGAPGEQVLTSLKKHELIGLCFYDSGDRSFYNTRRPIRTPADMAGLKIRVQNSNLYVAMVRALGADATPMDLGEVYQGLVQGVIDGAENNWPSYESGRHYEVARYYSLTRHVMAPEILVMSKSRWDRLPADDQDLIRACARESVPHMRALWDARVESARQRVLAAGIEANEVDDQSAFADLMRPVWDQFAVTPEQQALVEEILALGETSA